MDLLHQVSRPHEVRLPGARSGATHVYAGDGALRAEDDGATRSSILIGEVTHPDARHVGYAAMQNPAPQQKRPSLA